MLIKNNLNDNYKLLIEYLDEDGEKQNKYWQNNKKDIYLEGIKKITKARIGNGKKWKDVLNIIEKNMLYTAPVPTLAPLNKNEISIIEVMDGKFYNAQHFITSKVIKANICDLTKKITSINTQFVLIVTEKIYAVTQYRYIKHDFFIKDILNSLTPNIFLGYWFLSQNLSYGEFYNLCIFDTKKLIKYINDLNMDNQTILDKLVTNLDNSDNFEKNNTVFKFTNKTIAFYHDVNFLHSTYNFSNTNNYFIKTMLKSYNLESIEQIKQFYQGNFNIKLNEKEIQNFCKILNNDSNLINSPYTNSLLFNNHSKEIDNSFWLKIINKNSYIKSLSHNDAKKTFEICFVLCHYIYNNNFERKIGYYVKKLSDYNINCCVLIPLNSSKYTNKILFSSYFNEDNIIYVKDFNYSILNKFIKKYDIKYINFIDMIINNLDYDELVLLKNECKINLIISGFLSGLNKYIINNNKIIHNIITNSKSHSIIFKNENIKIHQYWETRENKIEINITEKKKKIVYIGRFYKEKQCELLYDAFCSIASKYSDFTFEFYGIGNTLDGKKNTSNIKIYNKWLSANEVNKVINESTFIIQNSISEGNPAIIWESFRLGTPVICSNIYGNNDCVINEKNGFLFDLDNYDKIKNNIVIYNNLEELYQKNLEFLNQFYSITKNNICIAITKAINLSKNQKYYKKMQDNCLQSYNNYANDLEPKEIYELFV